MAAPSRAWRRRLAVGDDVCPASGHDRQGKDEQHGHGGDDGTGWPFGGTIYFSRVYQQINDLPGVDRIEQVLITLDKTQYPVCQDVSIKPAALLYSTGHEVVVSYSFS